MSVSPGMIEIITRTGLSAAVYPVLMCSATGVPVGMSSRAIPSGVGMRVMRDQLVADHGDHWRNASVIFFSAEPDTLGIS